MPNLWEIPSDQLEATLTSEYRELESERAEADRNATWLYGQNLAFIAREEEIHQETKAASVIQGQQRQPADRVVGQGWKVSAGRSGQLLTPDDALALAHVFSSAETMFRPPSSLQVSGRWGKASALAVRVRGGSLDWVAELHSPTTVYWLVVVLEDGGNLAVPSRFLTRGGSVRAQRWGGKHAPGVAGHPPLRLEVTGSGVVVALVSKKDFLGGKDGTPLRQLAATIAKNADEVIWVEHDFGHG
jgi:hypothetical protein